MTVIAALYFGKDILLPITVAVLLSFHDDEAAERRLLVAFHLQIFGAVG